MIFQSRVDHLLETLLSFLHASDRPHADHIVRPAAVQRVPVGTPCQGGGERLECLLAYLISVGVRDLTHLALVLQVPDDDTVVGGCTQPVTVGGKGQGIDD